MPDQVIDMIPNHAFGLKGDGRLFVRIFSQGDALGIGDSIAPDQRVHVF